MIFALPSIQATAGCGHLKEILLCRWSARPDSGRERELMAAVRNVVRKCGNLTTFLPHFYHIFTTILPHFTTFYHNFTTISPHYFTTFHGILTKNLPHFTSLLPHLLPQFYHIPTTFYHNFTTILPHYFLPHSQPHFTTICDDPVRTLPHLKEFFV